MSMPFMLDVKTITFYQANKKEIIMSEKNIKKIKQDENKLVTFLKNNPIIVVLTFIGSVYQILQIVDFIIDKINIPGVQVEGKEIARIIFNFIALIIIIILLCENHKKNNQIKTYPYIDDVSDMKKIGIVKCTSKWKETEFTTIKCIKSIKKELIFMGIGGAKWIGDKKNKKLFEDMLERIANNDGVVKFLIMNPDNESLKNIKDKRGKQIIKESNYKIWIELVNNHPLHLFVKCYNHAPAFRLQFLDSTSVAVARYQFEWKKNNSNKNCHSPHLIINNTESMSFYYMFERYFNHEWDNAEDITKITRLN